MIGVVAYLALAVALPALLLGHQGQDWPLRVRRPRPVRQAREAACAPVSRPHSPIRLPRSLRHTPEASQARSAPSRAHTQPIKEN